jgi:hypothetical protein
MDPLIGIKGDLCNGLWFPLPSARTHGLPFTGFFFALNNLFDISIPFATGSTLPNPF